MEYDDYNSLGDSDSANEFNTIDEESLMDNTYNLEKSLLLEISSSRKYAIVDLFKKAMIKSPNMLKFTVLDLKSNMFVFNASREVNRTIRYSCVKSEHKLNRKLLFKLIPEWYEGFESISLQVDGPVHLGKILKCLDQTAVPLFTFNMFDGDLCFGLDLCIVVGSHYKDVIDVIERLVDWIECEKREYNHTLNLYFKDNNLINHACIDSYRQFMFFIENGITAISFKMYSDVCGCIVSDNEIQLEVAKKVKWINQDFKTVNSLLLMLVPRFFQCGPVIKKLPTELFRCVLKMLSNY